MKAYVVTREIPLRDLSIEFDTFMRRAAMKCGSGQERFTALLKPGDVLELNEQSSVTRLLMDTGLLEAAPVVDEGR